MYDDESVYGDYIPQVLLSQKVRRARKAHRCSTCPATIQPGQVYETEFWLVDGEATYVKTCPVCLDWKYGTIQHEMDELLKAGRR